MRHATRTSTKDARITIGDLVVDLERRLVTLRGNEVHLTPTEYALLKYLAVHAGKVLTHTMILNEVWGPGYSDSAVLRTAMNQLRAKLDDHGATPLIRTEPRIGYRLLEPDVEADNPSFMAPLLNPGPDLVRHELHRAPGERRFDPVVARVEQRPECADFVTKRQDLLRDALRRPCDHEALDAARIVSSESGWPGIAHHVERAGLRELGAHDVEVEAVRAVLTMRVAACRRLVVGHEDAARHAPAGGVGDSPADRRPST